MYSSVNLYVKQLLNCSIVPDFRFLLTQDHSYMFLLQVRFRVQVFKHILNLKVKSLCFAKMFSCFIEVEKLVF